MSDDTAPVQRASAWKEAGAREPIVQTAGIFDKPVETVKQGVNKVTEALTPTPRVTPADDPTLLSTKSKPTPELYLSIARYQEQVGKPELADQSYQQALRLSPKHLGAHLAYARFKDRRGEAQQALDLYQKAAKLHPQEAAVFNDMGLLYARHGEYAEALAAFGRAIEMQPKRELYRNNLAALLVDMGQPDQAMRHLLVVYPEADACYKLGYLLQQKGQTHQAITWFSKALALNPSMKEARAWLAHLRANSTPEPQVVRRERDAGSVAEPQPSMGRPEPGIEQDDPPARAPSPAAIEPSAEPRGAVRQLPPVLKRLPAPTSDSPSTSDATLAPEIRRLPPTQPGRRTAHQEASPGRARHAGWREENADGLPDAPLPPARPRANAVRLPPPPSFD